MKVNKVTAKFACTCAAVTALFASATLVFAETEEVTDKSFSIRGNGSIIMDVDFGSIKLRTHSDDKVVVHVVRKISRNKKADEEQFLRERPIEFSAENNSVTIRSHRQSRMPQLSLGRQRTEGVYSITVPEKFNVRLKTSGGEIDVADLTGPANVETSGGGLKFARVKGDIDGHTSGGAIRVETCEGKLNLHTSGGGISVKGGKGSLEGKTSGGKIEIADFQGPARVSTEGGGINVENMAGKLDGSTSGGGISASFVSLTDDVRLETAGGGVTVRLPGNSAFELDAATSGGGVSSELPVGGKTQRGKLKGPVNGGGKMVYLRTSGGGIHVKKL